MKRLMIMFAVLGMVISATAQMSPVQVSVQRVSKKDSTPGNVTHHGGMVYFSSSKLSAALSLRITLQNPLTGPVEDLVVRWGIAKTRLGASGHGDIVSYGGEEKCSLRSKELKVIETETVEADSRESLVSDRRSGEKIMGHGVQLLLGGKLVWEEFVPGSVKASFENLKPISELKSKKKPAKSDKSTKKH